MPTLGSIFGRIVSRIREYVKENLPSSLLPLAEELPTFLREQVIKIVQPQLRETFTTYRSFITSEWFYSLITGDPTKISVLPNQMIAIDVPMVGPDGRYLRFEVRFPMGRPFSPEEVDRKIAAQLAEEWKKRGIESSYLPSEYVKMAKYRPDYYLVTRQVRTPAE
jgi:hypothetical protein